MIGDVLYGSAENVEVKLLDFMTEIKASESFIRQSRKKRAEKRSSYEKKILAAILTAILTATLLIAGCSDMANVSAGQDNTMVLVEGWRDYGIYADKDTGVMYLVYQRNGTGCTVMLNADGTPKIWQGEE